VSFYSWIWALERISPARVAVTVSLNPVAAALLATVLLSEPITPNLIVGLIAVFSGIWIATTAARPSRQATRQVKGSAQARSRRIV
jgi:drug/metabolite transporter (DMT)-like permease